jgi:NAD(P)H-hydrate epimerase
MNRIDLPWINQIKHNRQPDGHKKSFGHVLIVAGSPGKVGAALLCARAALHAGCGMVTAMIPEEGVGPLLSNSPEIMYRTEADLSTINLEPYDAIAFGPGLGFTIQFRRNLEFLLQHYQGPIVFDADALTLLGSYESLISQVKPHHILTPHPGEFARLGGLEFDAVHREKQAIDFVSNYPCQLLLKGAPTIVVTNSGDLFTNTTGNDGMATAGSGDVLTGIIASLCAQEYAPDVAVRLGAYIHGFSGDLAIQKKSKASLVASDLIDHLSEIRLLD